MIRTNVQNTRNDTKVFLDPNVGIFFLSSRIDSLSDRLDALEASNTPIEDLRKLCDEIAASEQEAMDVEEARRVLRHQEREKALKKIRIKRKLKEKKQP